MWDELSVTLGPQELRALGEARGPAAAVRLAELGEPFFEVASGGGDALEAPLQYSLACLDALEELPAWERYSPPNRWLAEESNTWRLLHSLCADAALARPSETLAEHDRLSPKRLVQLYFGADRDVRLMQVVVDWLETCTRYQDDAVPPASRIGGTLQWENTLHHIQSGTSLFNASGTTNLITSFDPDAPHREKKNIHALDRQDDDNLCRRLFKELRCGRLEEAIALCVDSGQMWRGIILQGQRLLDYPELPQIDAKYPLIGNPSRDLWKWTCLKYLNEAEDNPHFKAALGVQCGNLPSILPLCGDAWEDLLWAHLRVQIELRVDQYLREHHSTVFIMPSENVSHDIFERLDSSPELSMNQIFGCVKSLYKNKVETFYQEIQRHLILDQIDSLLHGASTWIDSADCDLIRFLAHLVLVLRQIGKDPSRDNGDAVLKAYVKKLIENINKSSISPELIAHYTSNLPVRSQTEMYSEFMWLVEAKEDRSRVMESGIKAKLNVQAAAKETVRRAIKVLKEQILNVSNREFPNSNENNEKSQKIISRVIGSLEWLSFNDCQILDAVTMSNAIIRILIFKGDVESATAVLSRLSQFYPSSVIAKKLSDASDALREHLCLKAYLEAINGYATWYRQHISGRPKSPEPLLNNCSFTDKVHHEQIKAQIGMQREQWITAGIHQANHTKQLLYNVLLFPQGWLVDENGASNKINPGIEEFVDREKQLLSLRKLCVPEVVLLLIKVLQSSGLEGHNEAIRLSEILASDNRKLYNLFSKHKIREVLHKIGDSSLCGLENNSDPWGFKSVNV